MESNLDLLTEKLRIGIEYQNAHRGNKFKDPKTKHRSVYSTSMARCASNDPFSKMKITCSHFLDGLSSRTCCNICGKSRKFFCYSCIIPVAEIKDLIPQIKSLPCKVDVIKHPNEHDGKSTSVHAAIISPEFVKIHTFPNFPDYRKEDGVVLVYPGDGAVSMATMTGEQAVKIKKMVFIDSTWPQAKHIFKDPRLQALPCVVLETRNSLFWRYQRGKPDTYLATIEAIYYALVNLDERQQTDVTTSYDGRLDNLLFFFRYFYHKVNDKYFVHQIELEQASSIDVAI